MPRLIQLLFIVSLVLLSWNLMMAFHELGHVVGALLTGGTVERVILHPLRISRTDVVPNPNPAVVVWLGPIVGCALPLTIWVAIPQLRTAGRKIVQFVAGFCLIANGAYISFGSIEGIGDCGEMLRTGSPRWLLIVFGAVAISLGLYAWHRLGSPKQFLNNPTAVTPMMACCVTGALAAACAVQLVISSG